jgi:hypothetical protein
MGQRPMSARGPSNALSRPPSGPSGRFAVYGKREGACASVWRILRHAKACRLCARQGACAPPAFIVAEKLYSRIAD